MKSRAFQSYKEVIKYEHPSRIVRKYFDLYAYVWFHLEFWEDDLEERRPFTFIMRDWVYPHMKWFAVIMGVWYAIMLAAMWYSVMRCNYAGAFTVLIVSIFSGWLAAHLVWNADYIAGQQEWPPFIH